MKRRNDESVIRHKPGLQGLLGAVGLDVEYRRGQGDLLYYQDEDGNDVEILDLVGGYGTMLFGHQHPQIVAAITRFLAAGQANHVQGSLRRGALQLAAALNQRCQGDYCTVLANSGTEAVEAALKHAMLETGGGTFIALEGGFHGKTLGSLQVTSNPRFRQPFDNEPVQVVRVAAGDPSRLRKAFADSDDLAGLILEPIQGEAGVRPLTVEFLQLASQLCQKRGIPLIADESQTGLGRTGCFLASRAVGLAADYIILSKALGGGLAKIAALLIDRPRYCGQFDLIHSSTFADDELSCQVALSVLDLIDDQAMNACRDQGEYLIEQLRLLWSQYPNVIADVRGKGLMIGVELHRPPSQAGFLLNHLADRQLLVPLLASYLLHEHQIRIAPTLSDSATMRVQPSMLIGRDRLQQFVRALDDLCQRLARQDVVGLTRHLVRRTSRDEIVPSLPDLPSTIYRFRAEKAAATIATGKRDKSRTRRVAWVFHLIDSADLVHVDPALSELTANEKTAFCDRWSGLCEPVVMDHVDIRSSTDEAVRLFPILLPVTSQWMLDHSRGRRLASSRRLVQRAVDAAAALQCNVVTLGQFTSIVSRRGESLEHRGMQVTAGSNYTAALVSQAVRAELHQRSWDPAELTLAIVGAAGDIASTCATLMAGEYRQCILVGSQRAGSIERLSKVANRIDQARVSTSLHSIGDADVVVCAANSTTAPLAPEFLHDDAIVCDASVPSLLQPCLGNVLPNVTVFPGAIAELPGKEHLEIPGFPLPPGYTYGCMAEGLLLGLDASQRCQWSGRSSSRRAELISQVAARHGFTVAGRSSLGAIEEPCG